MKCPNCDEECELMEDDEPRVDVQVPLYVCENCGWIEPEADPERDLLGADYE